MLKIELDDGKYTYICHDDGRQEALRYGEPWRELVGDNLVRALASRIEDLTGEVKALEKKKIDWDVIGVAMREAGIPGDIAPLEGESQFLARIIAELHAKVVAASQLDEPEESAAEMVMKQCGGDHWGECSKYPREDWEYEASNGDTGAGYWDWVVSQAEGDEVDLETLTGVVGSAQ